MESGQRGTGGRRQQARVPFDQPIAVRYRLFQHFVEAISSNISPGGMFVGTRDPREPGSEFDFEFKLADGFSLIKGRGRVAWARRESGGPGRPAGMGVEFLEIDEKGRSIIERLVREHEKTGRLPFDLEREAPREAEAAAAGADGPRPVIDAPTPTPSSPAPSSAEPTAPEPAVPVLPASSPAETLPSREPGGGAMVAKRPRRPLPGPLRVAGLALISALIGALVLLLFHQLFIQPKIEILERQVERLAVGARRIAQTAPETGEGAAREAEADSPATAAPSPAAAGAELPDPREAVLGWARAWSERRVEDYLAFYSRDFTPPLSLSRAEWEEARRARILRPRRIRVKVALMEVEALDEGARRVRFAQSYESDTYKDLVRKTLDLAWENGAWKIRAEAAER